MIIMKKTRCLWYKLLTTGKRELGWEYGLSIPFIVGAYARIFNKDYSSLEGLKEIIDEIIATNEDEEICIMRCAKYSKISVAVIQVLSDIPVNTAGNIKENPMIANNIYTTLENARDFDSLAKELWNIHKSEILSGYFSAQKDEDREFWRPFNEMEQNIIDNL